MVTTIQLLLLTLAISQIPFLVRIYFFQLFISTVELLTYYHPKNWEKVSDKATLTTDEFIGVTLRTTLTCALLFTAHYIN